MEICPQIRLMWNIHRKKIVDSYNARWKTTEIVQYAWGKMRSILVFSSFRSFSFFLVTDMLTLAHWKTECLNSRNKITSTIIAFEFFSLFDSFSSSPFSCEFSMCVCVWHARVYKCAMAIFSCSLAIFLLCHILFLILLFWMVHSTKPLCLVTIIGQHLFCYRSPQHRSLNTYNSFLLGRLQKRHFKILIFILYIQIVARLRGNRALDRCDHVDVCPMMFSHHIVLCHCTIRHTAGACLFVYAPWTCVWVQMCLIFRYDGKVFFGFCWDNHFMISWRRNQT